MGRSVGCFEVPGWVAANEAIARKVLEYRDTGAREALIDVLACALDESCVPFPIVETGEGFDDICPFTFFAAFSRPMPDARRSRLMGLVCERFGLDVAVPETFEGYPLVKDYQARFFSHNAKTLHAEVDALWDVFEAALAGDAAAVEDGEGARTPSGAGDALADAYGRALRSSVAGAKALPTALGWVAPRRFPWLDGDLLAEAGIDPAHAGSKRGLTASEYAAYRAYCRRKAQAADCEGEAAPVVSSEEDAGVLPLMMECWERARPRTPALEADKMASLAEGFKRELPRLRALRPDIRRAVACFQGSWDIEAPDFGSMVEESLAGHDGLLCAGYMFNPHREITVLARREPEAVRAAFRGLFDEGGFVEERVSRFASTVCGLFERHRGEIVSAVARASSHGSFAAPALYLYLRYPEKYYPYSPVKLRALDKVTGYGCPYRVALPESVTYYMRLCDEVRTVLTADPGLVGRDVSPGCGAFFDDGGRIVEEHALVDDFARYAAELA